MVRKSLAIPFFALALSIPGGVAFGQEGGEHPSGAPPEEVAPEDVGQPNPLAQIPWIVGPNKAELGTVAEVQLKEGYRFAGPKDTQLLMRAMGNPVDGTELGFLAPDSLDWFVLFEFEEIGYVPDDEKDKLDGEAILTSIKEGNELANEERRQNGWSEVKIVGWDKPPAYNPDTHNLEWAVRGISDNVPVTNFNTRILGREGVMKANLVIDPEKLNEALPLFKDVLTGYSFKTGHTYAEYVKGDKLAEYGLTALVAGGAAAVAAKTGILAKLGKGIWKLLILVVAGVGALFKKLFGSKRVEG
jgi:uncharacterized membrane-anchored protein